MQVSYARILRSPRLGKVQTFAQVRLEGVRAWPVLGFRNWLVYYRETTTVIDVIDVLHGARDQQSRLQDGLRGLSGDASAGSESDGPLDRSRSYAIGLPLRAPLSSSCSRCTSAQRGCTGPSPRSSRNRQAA